MTASEYLLLLLAIVCFSSEKTAGHSQNLARIFVRLQCVENANEYKILCLLTNDCTLKMATFCIHNDEDNKRQCQTIGKFLKKEEMCRRGHQNEIAQISFPIETLVPYNLSFNYIIGGFLKNINEISQFVLLPGLSVIENNRTAEPNDWTPLQDVNGESAILQVSAVVQCPRNRYGVSCQRECVSSEKFLCDENGNHKSLLPVAIDRNYSSRNSGEEVTRKPHKSNNSSKKCEINCTPFPLSSIAVIVTVAAVVFFVAIVIVVIILFCRNKKAALRSKKRALSTDRTHRWTDPVSSGVYEELNSRSDIELTSEHFQIPDNTKGAKDEEECNRRLTLLGLKTLFPPTLPLPQPPPPSPINSRSKRSSQNAQS